MREAGKNAVFSPAKTFITKKEEESRQWGNSYSLCHKRKIPGSYPPLRNSKGPILHLPASKQPGVGHVTKNGQLNDLSQGFES